MIILDSTTKKLEALTGEAISTNKLSFSVNFVEMTSSTYVPAELQGNNSSGGLDNTAGGVTILSAPGSAGTYRLVKLITILNDDTISHNVKVQLDISGTNYVLFSANLEKNSKLVYTDNAGWRTYGPSGIVKMDKIADGLLRVSAGTSNMSSGQIVFSNTNNATFGINGQTITASFAPDSYWKWWNGPQIRASAVAVITNQSKSQAVAFHNGGYVSVDFIRFPVSLTTNSTAYAATTNANTVASVAMYTTYNVVIYSQGTGASSTNLISFLSGSVGWTQINRVSQGASNNHSYSCTYSAYYLNSQTASFTTQTSLTSASYQFSFSASMFSRYSGARYLDVPLVNGGVASGGILPPGAYWLVFGMSTSSTTNAAWLVNASGLHCRLSTVHNNSCINTSFGIPGITNNYTSNVWGAGVFSTNAAVTTSAIPISAISTTGNSPHMMFMLLGSNAVQ